jgi:hypothetical protein
MSHSVLLFPIHFAPSHPRLHRIRTARNHITGKRLPACLDHFPGTLTLSSSRACGETCMFGDHRSGNLRTWTGQVIGRCSAFSGFGGTDTEQPACGGSHMFKHLGQVVPRFQPPDDACGIGAYGSYGSVGTRTHVCELTLLKGPVVYVLRGEGQGQPCVWR